MRMRCAEVTNVSGHWCELAKLINTSVDDTTTCGAGVTARPPYVVTLLERQHSVICIAEVNSQWIPPLVLSAAVVTNFHPAYIGIYPRVATHLNVCTSISFSALRVGGLSCSAHL
jgi:hypothetical protein